MDKTSDPTLAGYVVAILRRWIIVVGGGLIGLLAGGVFVAVTPPSYVATSEVNINVITSDPFNTARAASGLLDTPGEARLASSHAVAERVAASLPGEDAREVQGRISVTGAQDSPTLRISAVGESPAAARDLADGVAEEYLAYRSGQAQERIDRTVQRSRDRLQEQRVSLQEATDLLATADPGSADALQAEVDRSLINLEISSLLNEIVAAEGIDTAGGTIINPAAAASVDRQPAPLLLLATGLLAGLALGLMVALIRDGLDPRVRGRRDLDIPGGAAFAVHLPERQDGIPPLPGDLEQLLVLREALLGKDSVSPGAGVISVVDLTGSPGARSAPFAVGTVFARGGHAVRLVELLTDPRETLEATPYEDLQLQREWGGDGFGSFRSEAVEGLTFARPVPSSALAADEPLPAGLRQIVVTERDQHLVLVSLPTGSSPAARLAAFRLSDVVVVVVARRLTQRAQFQQVLADARSFGIPAIGTISVERGRRPAPALQPRRRHSRHGHHEMPEKVTEVAADERVM